VEDEAFAEYAREKGIGRVFGDVLRKNDRMLRMARDVKFEMKAPDAGSDTITVEILLADAKARDSSEALNRGPCRREWRRGQHQSL
jgi:hypothetical protein